MTETHKHTRGTDFTTSDNNQTGPTSNSTGTISLQNDWAETQVQRELARCPLRSALQAGDISKQIEVLFQPNWKACPGG